MNAVTMMKVILSAVKPELADSWVRFFGDIVDFAVAPNTSAETNDSTVFSGSILVTIPNRNESQRDPLLIIRTLEFV